MKLTSACTKCTWDEFEKSGRRKVHLQLESIKDNGLYEFTCPNGHIFIVFDATIKFRLLFESGIYAYIDGYNREAIGSICASLERFYEYGSNIIANSLGVEFDQLEDTLKQLKNSSERQIGAFYFLYNIMFRKPLKFLNNNDYFGFRNKVVHQGVFPTDKETIDLIYLVFLHIIDVVYDLATNCKDSMIKWRARKMEEFYKIDRTGKSVQFIGPKMILDFDIEEPYKLTIEDLKKKIEAYRNGSSPRQHGVVF